MLDWFRDLNSLQQIYAVIAIPSTLVIVLQTILLFFGMGDADVDVDFDVPDEISFDGDGLAVFTIRGIMAFLCIGGWSGLALAGSELPNWVSILLSTVCGVAALIGTALLIKFMLSLQDSGNMEIGNSVGKVGQVYIPIPAKGKGSGKITVVFQGKFSELSAISTEQETLKTCEAVRVIATDETGMVVVERVVKD